MKDVIAAALYALLQVGHLDGHSLTLAELNELGRTLAHRGWYLAEDRPGLVRVH